MRKLEPIDQSTLACPESPLLPGKSAETLLKNWRSKMYLQDKKQNMFSSKQMQGASGP